MDNLGWKWMKWMGEFRCNTSHMSKKKSFLFSNCVRFCIFALDFR